LALLGWFILATNTAAKNQRALVFVIDPELSKPKYINGPIYKPLPKENKAAAVTSRPRPSNSPTSPSYNGRNYSKEEVIQLIKDYSAQYGIEPVLPLAIARCESGYNQFSKNKSSTASGVFQYLSSTWQATDQGKLGLSVFDANANVKAAVSYIAIHKSTRPWLASVNCWSN
jgi:soluble lytic murein transglycosylase-like protein